MVHGAGGRPPDEYRKLAFDQGDGNFFDAAAYDPTKWAELAKAAGMKYVVLTARHHDGFALFDSKHPNAFTSVQTLKRDLISRVCRCDSQGRD